MPATDEGAACWGVLDIQAKRLATAVFESIGKMQTGASTVTLQVAVNSATCPGQYPHFDSKTGQTTTEDTPTVSIKTLIMTGHDGVYTLQVAVKGGPTVLDQIKART
jgi:hypothetical protein